MQCTRRVHILTASIMAHTCIGQRSCTTSFLIGVTMLWVYTLLFDHDIKLNAIAEHVDAYAALLKQFKKGCLWCGTVVMHGTAWWALSQWTWLQVCIGFCAHCIFSLHLGHEPRERSLLKPKPRPKHARYFIVSPSTWRINPFSIMIRVWLALTLLDSRCRWESHKWLPANPLLIF